MQNADNAVAVLRKVLLYLVKAVHHRCVVTVAAAATYYWETELRELPRYPKIDMTSIAKLLVAAAADKIVPPDAVHLADRIGDLMQARLWDWPDKSVIK